MYFGNVGTGISLLVSCIWIGLLEKQVSAAYASFPRLLNLLQKARDRQGLPDCLK